MNPLELPNRSPDASIAVEPGEPATDALVRLAERVGVDITETDPRLQEVADGSALDRLFDVRDPPTDDERAVLVLELWGRLFVLTPAMIEVYRCGADRDARDPR